MGHAFISKPVSSSRSAAEDPYKKLVVTCWSPIISRAETPNRKIPGTRNAQLAASNIWNRNRRDELLCANIRHFCLSSLRAESAMGQDHWLFRRIYAAFGAVALATPSSKWGCTPMPLPLTGGFSPTAKLPMNPPSLSPTGERVSEGRVRGCAIGSRSQCMRKKRKGALHEPDGLAQGTTPDPRSQSETTSSRRMQPSWRILPRAAPWPCGFTAFAPVNFSSVRWRD